MIVSKQISPKKVFSVYAFLFIATIITATLADQPLWYVLPFAALLIPVIVEHPGYLFILLIISLPLSMEFQVTEKLGTDLPDELIMWAVTGISILLLIHQAHLIDNKFYRHPLFYFLVAHILWIAFTCIFSQEPFLSIKYLLAKTWYIIPFIFFLQIFLQQKRSLLMIILCLVIPMCFVVLQAIVRHASFGFMFESVNKTVVPFFRNHVNYGAMLACMFPLVFALIKHFSPGRLRWLLKCLLILFTAGIILSYSRGAWLALLVGAIVYFAIVKKLMNWLFLSAAVIIVLGFTWLGYQNKYMDYRPNFNKTIFHTDFAQHMTATYQLRDLSTAERFYRWIAAIRLTSDYPLSGVGPNNFYYNYKPYAVAAFKTWVSRNNDHSTVHNYFILTMCEQGIPGLIIFTSLLFACFYYAQKIYHQAKDKVHKTTAITIGCILGIITTVNFLSDLIETDKIGSIFFLCIGVLIWLDINRQKKRRKALHLYKTSSSL